MSSSTTNNNKARWGLVSTARVNRHIIAAITADSPLATIAAVASRSAATAEKYAEAQKIPKSFPSYNAMLSSDDVDCVYISLPNNAHTDVVIRAAENGKHILCEKPMAPTAAEVSRMFDAAQKNGVILMEGFMNLHSAVVHKARQLLEDGAIGEIIGMNAIFTYTETRGGFRRSASIAEGGGVLYDVGSYCVALARFLVGREPTSCHCVQEKVPVPADESDFATSPTTTTTTLSNDNNDDENGSEKNVSSSNREVDETSSGILIFSKRSGDDVRPSPFNGAITFQFLTSFSSPLNMGFTIVGTKGQMKIRNPYKPNPLVEEEILLQHDIDEPPVSFKVKGVGLQEDLTSHLYQGEVDAISKFVLSSRADQQEVLSKNNQQQKATKVAQTNNNNNNQENNNLNNSASAGMFPSSSSFTSRHSRTYSASCSSLFAATIPGTPLLSRAFSVGNAACLEALHQSAQKGTVEKIFIHP
jgi:predicted dehydrogenase